MAINEYKYSKKKKKNEESDFTFARTIFLFTIVFFSFLSKTNVHWKKSILNLSLNVSNRERYTVIPNF